MKKIIFFALISLVPALSWAQSETISALKDRLADPFTVYLYHNTLRMLNQTDDKEFDEMIKDIEKMRLLLVDKVKNNFGLSDYQKLLKDYRSESYEEIMTMRHEGRNFDVYFKDKKGATKGTVILVNDSTSLYILDILGTIDVRQASKLFNTIDDSSEMGAKIKSFMSRDGKKKDKHHKEEQVD